MCLEGSEKIYLYYLKNTYLYNDFTKRIDIFTLVWV